jgi:phenylpropionate dioxygenase-like ring-hydroxylating dioxygenase large terminal subunit
MFGRLAKADYRGHIDSVSDGHVRGWAYNASAPRKRVAVEIYAAGVLLGTTRADIFRADLAEAGIGDGTVAFVFVLPAAAAYVTITARVAGTDFWLVNESDPNFDSRATQVDARKTISPGWARSTIDSEAFRMEQERFAHVWTFLCLSTDLANEDDWIRTTIGLRSVFVQRISGELKGFENRCAHRLYPLRTADKGNGPIVCGFHHWRYDGDGRVLGIPACQETFGVVARGLDARLTSIEVAVCGSLVFGRFSSPDATGTGTLEDFLGAAFPVLAGLSKMSRRPQHFSTPIEAHWKLCMHVAVDDYHLAAVHPRTFGKVGYLRRKHLTYTRLGPHSAYQQTREPNAFKNLASKIADGTALSSYYFVIHLMPGLVLAHAHVWGGYYTCCLIQFVPESPHSSRQRVWTFRSPLGWGASRIPRLLRPLMDPYFALAAMVAARYILREDAGAAEHLQSAAHGFTAPLIIGNLEERVAWFEDAYRKIMAGEPIAGD